jgi:membrane associated rhomboid family serine protease
LLIGLIALFVLQALLENFLGVPIVQLLALNTTQLSLATAWQLVTHVFVVPPVRGVELSLLLSLAFIWLILAPFEARYGRTRVVQLTLVSALSAGVPALLVGQLLPSMAGGLAGPQVITLCAISGYAIMLPQQAEVSFFGLFPMRAKHLIGVVFAFSLLAFLTTRDAAQLAADLGAIGGGVGYCKYWLERPPRQRSRKQGRSRGGPYLRAVPRDDDPDPKRWLN